MRRTLFLLICILAVVYAAPFSWKEIKAEGPTNRFSHAAALIQSNDTFQQYVFGGYDDQQVPGGEMWLSETSYSGASTWKQMLSSFSRAGHSASNIMYENKTAIIIHGGLNDTSVPNTQIYNISDNSWTNMSLGLDRQLHAAEVYQNKLYVFGGNHIGFDSVILSNFSVLSLEPKNVENLASDPPARAGATLTATSLGKMYLFGGQGVNDVMYNDLWVYDVTQNTWSTAVDCKTSNCPTPRAYHTVVDIESGILLYGGCNLLTAPIQVFDEMWYFAYNQSESTPTWRRLPTGGGPVGRCSHSAVLLHVNTSFVPADNTLDLSQDATRALVVFGGISNQGALHDQWIYQISLAETSFKTINNPGTKAVGGACIFGFVLLISGLAFMFRRQNR